MSERVKRQQIRKQLRERDGDNCCWCGIKLIFNCKLQNRFNTTIEHLVRRCEGGSNKLENLKLACRKCNNSRHSKSWDVENAEVLKKKRFLTQLNLQTGMVKLENTTVLNTVALQLTGASPVAGIL